MCCFWAFSLRARCRANDAALRYVGQCNADFDFSMSAQGLRSALCELCIRKSSLGCCEFTIVDLGRGFGYFRGL